VSKTNYRKYKKEPYSVATVHGGPGAPGGMAYVAEKLSEKFGVIEPFQTSLTVRGQIEELHSVINETCNPPVVMIGHSWGAWLAFMLAAEFPYDVSKLILVSAGPFEHSFDVTTVRLSRLEDAEQKELLNLMNLMNDSSGSHLDSRTFRRFAELTSKADSFDPVETEESNFDFQPEIYRSIWPEAEILRKNGILLKLGERIRCPVIAIHGDYDPHPAEGVKVPLEKVLKDFKFILLKDCGHYPWKEKMASEHFFRILHAELGEK
jgi:pimeloyl-ACP methyl ester carboxylesterase